MITKSLSKKEEHITSTEIVYDIDRLEFPQGIAPFIGVRKETINFWKRKGCRFIGRKTTIRWVRQFMINLSGGFENGIA